MSHDSQTGQKKFFSKRTRITWGVVWAIERFKYYLYVKNFTVIAEHQVLISALSKSERSKTSQSRLTRLIERIVLLSIEIEDLAGNKIGLTDYMSPNSVGLALPKARTMMIL